MKEFIKGNHKLTVEEIAPGVDRLTYFEQMGGRWVPLGPSEDWTRAASLELFEEWED